MMVPKEAKCSARSKNYEANNVKLPDKTKE